MAPPSWGGISPWQRTTRRRSPASLPASGQTTSCKGPCCPLTARAGEAVWGRSPWMCAGLGAGGFSGPLRSDLCKDSLPLSPHPPQRNTPSQPRGLRQPQALGGDLVAGGEVGTVGRRQLSASTSEREVGGLHRGPAPHPHPAATGPGPCRGWHHRESLAAPGHGAPWAGRRPLQPGRAHTTTWVGVQDPARSQS